MPIYEYVCDSCKRKFEKLTKFEQRDDPHPCSACDSATRRVPSVIDYRMRGRTRNTNPNKGPSLEALMKSEQGWTSG